MLTRRAFLHATVATGAAALAEARGLPGESKDSPLRVEAGLPSLERSRGQTRRPDAQYDLVIRGGRVIDPTRRLDSLMDVAISDGKIADVLPAGAAAEAASTFDATGRLVVPGLIDIHTHARSKEMPSICLADGVTSLIDAGSHGADHIDDVVSVAKSAPNRVRILLNIAKTGILPDGELKDLNRVDVAAARRAIERHRDFVVGVKARLSRSVAGENDLEALRRAQAIVGPSRLRVMVHVGDTASPLPAILALLKTGDIVTHVYSPSPNGIFDESGKVLPDVVAARRRGIRFDIGNGRTGHLTWGVAEQAIRQKFLPDTISSDWTDAARTDQVFDFPNVLSKFLALGLPLDQVIERATIQAAHTFPAFGDLGTLRIGAPADISILELRTGDFAFVDNANTPLRGTTKLFAHATVVSGKLVRRPA